MKILITQIQEESVAMYVIFTTVEAFGLSKQRDVYFFLRLHTKFFRLPIDIILIQNRTRHNGQMGGLSAPQICSI